MTRNSPMKTPRTGKNQARANRRTPLQTLWRSVKVQSCADGTMVVRAKWKLDGLYPGVLTRLSSAKHLERVVNAHLKGTK